MIGGFSLELDHVVSYAPRHHLSAHTDHLMKQFTEEERKEIRSHFDYFDRDGNNEMDVDEFTRLLKTIAPEASDGAH